MALNNAQLGAMFGGGAGFLKNYMDIQRHQGDVASRAIEARFAPLQGKSSPSFADLKAPDTLQTAIDYGLAAAQFGKQFGAKDAVKGEGSKILKAVSGNQQSALASGLGPLSPNAASQEALQAKFSQSQPLVGNTPDALFQDNIYNPQLANFLSQVPRGR